MTGRETFLAAYGFAGELRCSRDGDTLVIDHADPRVLISREMLDVVRSGASPYATLTGDVLRIEASNLTVIYRVEGVEGDAEAYAMEWPD